MLCSVLLALVALVCQARVYDVKDFGAKGDGKTLDHVAINKAIETATSEGGGQVVVPAGTYLCGSIRLKSKRVIRWVPGVSRRWPYLFSQLPDMG